MHSTYVPKPVEPSSPTWSDPRIRPVVDRLSREHELSQLVCAELLGAYLPLCAEVDRAARGVHGPIVVGVSGAQGSGKTTFTAFAQALLGALHGHRVVAFSIDDFYLPLDRRSRLAGSVHPLLSTRGVPGTHDVVEGIATLDRILTAGADDVVSVPRFDKAVDDRVPEDGWVTVRGPVDIVLFEGWCVGTGPQDEAALEEPVNELERTDDPDGAWRRHVNEQLRTPYHEWFGLIDLLVYFQAPAFSYVREWRWLQEQKLARDRPDGSAVMGDDALSRFMMFYERITEHALRTLPDRADIVCRLDRDHRIVRIDRRPRSGG